MRHLRLPAAGEQLPQPRLRQRHTRVRRIVAARNAVELHRKPLPAAGALPAPRSVRAVRDRRGGIGREGLIVLGKVVEGTLAADLKVGMEMELTTMPLFTDDDGVERIVHAWRIAS